MRDEKIIFSYGYNNGHLDEACDVTYDIRQLHGHGIDLGRFNPIKTDGRALWYQKAMGFNPVYYEAIQYIYSDILENFDTRISIMCANGIHRAVIIAEILGKKFRARGLKVKIIHRDVDKKEEAIARKHIRSTC